MDAIPTNNKDPSFLGVVVVIRRSPVAYVTPCDTVSTRPWRGRPLERSDLRPQTSGRPCLYINFSHPPMLTLQDRLLMRELKASHYGPPLPLMLNMSPSLRVLPGAYHSCVHRHSSGPHRRYLELDPSSRSRRTSRRFLTVRCWHGNEYDCPHSRSRC